MTILSQNIHLAADSVLNFRGGGRNAASPYYVIGGEDCDAAASEEIQKQSNF